MAIPLTFMAKKQTEDVQIKTVHPSKKKTNELNFLKGDQDPAEILL